MVSPRSRKPAKRREPVVPPPPPPRAPTTLGELCTSTWHMREERPIDVWWRTATDAEIIERATAIMVAEDAALTARLAEAEAREAKPGGRDPWMGNGTSVREIRSFYGLDGNHGTVRDRGPWRAMGQQQTEFFADRLSERGRGDGTVDDAAMERVLVSLENHWSTRSATLRTRIIRGMPLPFGRYAAKGDRYGSRDPWSDVMADRIVGDGYGRDLRTSLGKALVDGRTSTSDLLVLARETHGAILKLPGVLDAVHAAMDQTDRATWDLTAKTGEIAVAILADPAWRASSPEAWRAGIITHDFRHRQMSSYTERHCLYPVAASIAVATRQEYPPCGIIDACMGIGAVAGTRSSMDGDDPGVFHLTHGEDGDVHMRPQGQKQFGPLHDLGARRPTDAEQTWREAVIAHVATWTPGERRAAAIGLGHVQARLVGTLAGMHHHYRDGGITVAAACGQYIHMARQTTEAIAAWGPDAVAAHAEIVDDAVVKHATGTQGLTLLAALSGA